MIEAKTVFQNEDEKKAYVLACEHDYESKLDDAVSAIMKRRDVSVLTLSGPTCAGKTTTAKKLISEFSAEGRTVHMISIDDFYYDRSVLLERAAARGGEIDFDSPTTIDMEALAFATGEILRGDPVDIPKFDFVSGTRVGFHRILPGEKDVYIFEGIQAVYPEVTALFRECGYLGIFVSPEDDLLVGDTLFPKNRVRLFRRMVRDHLFRGATPVFTLKLWEGVRENEDLRVFPYGEEAEIRFNSSLGYELSMLKPHLAPLLGTIPASHPFFSDAQAALAVLERIEEISSAYIPETSLYHEFLG